MTQRAKELGATNTNFKNPHGLIEGLVIIAIVLMLPDGMRHLLTAAFGPPDDSSEDATVAEARHV